ncbi:protein lin-37 homolog [Corticium candelabrum]|uniref:protein lin-37 homolog n=1 Tax=Corticium candelabrum TaxID=121492 RepID=UPI002E32BF41|nr:protein lin-37 homolog [Corticium candelabrum]
MSELDRRTRSSSASSKLETLLQELIDNPSDRMVNPDQDSSERRSPDEVDPTVGSCHASPDQTSTTSSPRKSNIGKSPRKRRRRVLDESGGKFGGTTHIMKFRDRKVDLAQFDDTTSMYMLCRAWMMNNPSQTALQAEQLPSFPPQTQPSHVNSNSLDASQSLSITSANQPLLAVAAAAESILNSKEIWRLPSPDSKKNPDENECLHSGEHVKELSSFDLQADQQEASVMEDLKKQHIERWKKVRTSWKDHLTRKHVRYAKSLELLRTVWQQHQEKMMQSGVDRSQWET